MNRAGNIDALEEKGIRLFSDYLERKRTDDLRALATVVVEMRRQFTTKDGDPDLGGRTEGYRQSIAHVYARAGIPEEEMDTVQAALRYHVGNELRERFSAEELARAGLSSISPKERLTVIRKALQAQREISVSRRNVVKLSENAQAILDYVDLGAIKTMTPDQAKDAKRALEKVLDRSLELLAFLE